MRYEDIGGVIRICYNTGNVNGSNHVGGVCGLFVHGSSISNCYNTGNISGGDIYGLKDDDSTTDTCYYIAESDIVNGGRTATQFADGSVTWY